MEKQKTIIILYVYPYAFTDKKYTTTENILLIYRGITHTLKYNFYFTL